VIDFIIDIYDYSAALDIKNLLLSLLMLLGILVAMIVYIIVHELIHGIFFKKYSGKKAQYGFTGLYAYAKSEAYFNKRQYLVIGLAPVVLLGLFILLLNIFLPERWFWGIYIMQILNLSGAAGDIYIAWLMSRLPADILVTDEGTAMTIYSRTE
jgi:fatty acid desaturase